MGHVGLLLCDDGLVDKMPLHHSDLALSCNSRWDASSCGVGQGLARFSVESSNWGELIIIY